MNSDDIDIKFQPDLFGADKANSNSDDWECIKFKTGDTVWYLAKTEDDKKKYEKPTKSGYVRPVFSRNELYANAPWIRAASQSARLEWLRWMIAIKQSIPGAIIESTKKPRKSQTNANTATASPSGGDEPE